MKESRINILFMFEKIIVHNCANPWKTHVYNWEFNNDQEVSNTIISKNWNSMTNLVQHLFFGGRYKKPRHHVIMMPSCLFLYWSTKLINITHGLFVAFTAPLLVPLKLHSCINLPFWPLRKCFHPFKFYTHPYQRIYHQDKWSALSCTRMNHGRVSQMDTSTCISNVVIKINSNIGIKAQDRNTFLLLKETQQQQRQQQREQ